MIYYKVKGKVKFINTRGFGFIHEAYDDQGYLIPNDIFFHATDLPNWEFMQLPINQDVFIEVVTTDALGKLRAGSVEVINDEFDKIIEEMSGAEPVDK